MPTYDRPRKATLHVHLEGGETWEAKPEDLEKFNLVNRHAAYMAFDGAYSKILRDAGLVEGDITNALLNPLRYLVETAVANPDLLDHEEHHEWREVAVIERLLREALPNDCDDVRDLVEQEEAATAWLQENRNEPREPEGGPFIPTDREE